MRVANQFKNLNFSAIYRFNKRETTIMNIKKFIITKFTVLVTDLHFFKLFFSNKNFFLIILINWIIFLQSFTDASLLNLLFWFFNPYSWSKPTFESKRWSKNVRYKYINKEMATLKTRFLKYFLAYFVDKV